MTSIAGKSPETACHRKAHSIPLRTGGVHLVHKASGLGVAVITALLFAMPARAAEVEPPAFFAANEELRALLIEAGENNPGLLSLYEEWRAALERIPQATSLDDPMFTYGQFLQSDVKRARFALSQEFPWFGTLRTRGTQAGAEADAALSRFYAERNRVFADVKKAYFEYAFLARRIEVTKSQATVLSYMEDVARSRLALGLAYEDELLRVSIQRTKLEDECTGFEQLRPALSAVLDEAVGVAANGERPWPQDVAFPPPLPPETAVAARIRAVNPELRSYDHLIESRQQQALLAKKKGYPDFGLGLEYAFMGTSRQAPPDRLDPGALTFTRNAWKMSTGATPLDSVGLGIGAYGLAVADEARRARNRSDDDITVSVSMNLPIWRKRVRAGVEEARLMESATVHEKQRKTLELDKAAQMAVYGVTDAQRRYTLYETSLIPQAQETYDSLLGRYATAMENTGFLDVMTSVDTVLMFQLEQCRAARDWQQAAADLELLLGGPWDADAPVMEENAQE